MYGWEGRELRGLKVNFVCMKNNVGKINGTFVNIGKNLYFFMRMKNPKSP